MKRAVAALSLILLAGVTLVSCGKSTPPTTGTTGLKFRAFISQDVTNSTGTISAGILIANAEKDLLAGRVTAGTGCSGGVLSAGSFLPTTLVESDNRQFTLAMSLDNTQFEIINNSTEAGTSCVNLAPAYTQSLAISPDSTTVYAASPTVAIPGGLPGAVLVIATANGQVSSKIPVRWTGCAIRVTTVN